MHNADLYHQSNDLPKRDALACLKNHASKMRWKNKNNRIIDVGCGDGSVTIMLKNYLPSNFTLLGSDISEDMVRFATEKYCNKQTTFTVLDIAGNLPEVMKENFDHVFSSFTLNWVIDQKRAFKNIFNLLDQDGECFLIILAHCSIYDVYRTFSKTSKWNTWVNDVDKYISPYHDSEAPDKEIMTLMETTGFANIKVDCKDMVFHYKDKGHFKRHMTSVCPFEIPTDKFDDFMNDFVEVLQDIEIKYKTSDNNFSNGPTLHYKLLTAYGYKPLNVV